jgi:hypothetical protein
MIDENPIRARYQASVLRSTRVVGGCTRRRERWAPAGGMAAVSGATKVARSTIGRGVKDLIDPGWLSGTGAPEGRRRPTAAAKAPPRLEDLPQSLEPAARGDPRRPLRWVSKSHEKATARHEMGRERYSATRQVMVAADCGGSNGPRLRLWKVERQRLADETGVTFQVCHYPPGTANWHKIEHRMFCRITQNWRATPLTSRLAGIVGPDCDAAESTSYKMMCCRKLRCLF